MVSRLVCAVFLTLLFAMIVIPQLPSEPRHVQKDKLGEVIEVWQDIAEQEDEICMIGVKI